MFIREHTIGEGMIKEERIVLRIDPALKRRIMEKARLEDRTLSQIVRRLLLRWLEEPPDEIPYRRDPIED